MLDYISLGILIFVSITIFYGIIIDSIKKGARSQR